MTDNQKPDVYDIAVDTGDGIYWTAKVVHFQQNDNVRKIQVRIPQQGAQLLQQGEAVATIIQHPHINAKEIEYRHTDLDKYPPGTELFAGAPTSQAEHKFIMDMYFSYEELDLTAKDTDSIYLKGVKQLIKVIKDEQADTQQKLDKAREALKPFGVAIYKKCHADLQQGEAVAYISEASLTNVINGNDVIMGKRTDIRNVPVFTTPPVQQGEAVAEIVTSPFGDNETCCVQFINDNYKPQKGDKLFTTPPDTQQKLDKAREALRDASESSCRGAEDWIAIRIKLQKALKDIS